ncbi:hypothetical protein ACUY3M_00075 [Corynebacterium suicordis]|nr:hypothetical protein [uncultured Corynebacterium sp.]
MSRELIHVNRTADTAHPTKEQAAMTISKATQIPVSSVEDP